VCLDLSNPHLSADTIKKRGDAIASACRARTPKGQQRALRLFWGS
jgi:hypothetical protein